MPAFYFEIGNKKTTTKSDGFYEPIEGLEPTTC